MQLWLKSKVSISTEESKQTKKRKIRTTVTVNSLAYLIIVSSTVTCVTMQDYPRVIHVRILCKCGTVAIGCKIR